jgi:hypothetical protein
MKQLAFLLTLTFTTSVFTITLCAAQESPNVTARRAGTSAAESQSSSAQEPGSGGTQTRSAAGQSTATSVPASSNSGQQTISGCLNQAGMAYTLTDSQTGTVYKLTGNTGHLSSHVGHEMQMTGKAGNENATAAPSATSGRPYPFQVSTVKEVADQCGPSGATANGPSL